MDLTVVGCSGSVSGPDSPASSYLVQAPHQGRTFSLVLDLGPGAFGALYRYLDPRELDAVALSHLHPDHCLDLCALYIAGAHSPTAPWRRIPVLGPPGTAVRISRAHQVPGAAEEPAIGSHFDYRDWRPEQRLGPFTVRTARVAHPVEAYAIRLTTDDGASLTYSGDTGPTPALAALAAGSDLLLVESAFAEGPDNPPDLHLTGRQAAQVAAEAGVAGMVLTHIPPWRDVQQALAEARPHFTGPISAAAPGARWTMGFSGQTGH